MTCPACGLENVPSAQYCDCGYWLGNLPSKPIRRIRLFTIGHILQAWMVGAALVMAEGILSWFLPIPPLWWLPPIFMEKFSNGPIGGLLFYSLILGALAFWPLDWFCWHRGTPTRRP